MHGRLRTLGAVGIAGLAVAGAVATVYVGLVPEEGGYVAGRALFAAGLLAAAFYVAWHVEPAWLLIATILLSTFSGNWDLLGLPSGVAPDRFALFAATAGVLLRSPALPNRRPLRIEPVHILLGATLAWAIGSAIVTETLIEGDTPFLLMDRFAAPFAAFFLAPYAFRSERHRRALLVSFIAFGAYLGVTALLEVAGADALIFPQFIADPELGYHSGRAQGPFLEAAVNGMALFVCAVSAAIAFVTFERRGVRIAAGIVGTLCVLGLLLTLTRSVWVAAIAATLVTMLAVRELRRYTLRAVIAVAALVLVALVTVPGLQSSFEERVEADRSVWERRNVNGAALNVVADRPLLGLGMAQFPEESDEYFPLLEDIPQVGSSDVAIHNVLLLFATELGLIGAGLFVASFLTAVGSALFAHGPPRLRPWKIGLLAIAVFWLVLANFAPIGYVFPSMITWLWAGVVLGGALPARAVRAVRARPAHGRASAPAAPA
jgi:O-antigen ligase